MYLHREKLENELLERPVKVNYIRYGNKKKMHWISISLDVQLPQKFN